MTRLGLGILVAISLTLPAVADPLQGTYGFRHRRFELLRHSAGRDRAHE